jgi:hypothetical protein
MAILSGNKTGDLTLNVLETRLVHKEYCAGLNTESAVKRLNLQNY